MFGVGFGAGNLADGMYAVVARAPNHGAAPALENQIDWINGHPRKRQSVRRFPKSLNTGRCRVADSILLRL